MTVEIFTKEHFESVLPIHKDTGIPVWSPKGLDKGEYAYEIPVTSCCIIQIRSSVKANGKSAGTGEDSIRCWIAGKDGKPVGAKISNYTQRTPGWEKRLSKTLRELYRRGMLVQVCEKCKDIKKIFKVKKENQNKGRLFLTCDCSFQWLT